MLRHYIDGAFGSRHMNLLNLHLGIVNMGQVLRLQVNAVFLYTLGLSLAEVCFAMGALIGLRFILRTPLVYIPHLYGSKVALFVGQFILACAFALYAISDGPGWLLWGALFLMSAGEALYWHAVHTTFATLSESGKFGRQLSARALFMAGGALAAPLLTVLLHDSQGWGVIYAFTGFSLLLSLVPLLFMPEPCPPQPLSWRKGWAVSKSCMKLFAGWGAGSALLMIIWPLILYKQFGTVESFAEMIFITTLIGIFISIVIARRIDIGKIQNIVTYGGILYVCSVLMLAWQGTTPLSIALILAAISLTSILHTQPFNAALYRWAKETKDPLWFHYWSEFGWDLGNLFILWGVGAALLLWPEINLRWMLILIIPVFFWCYHVYFTDGKSRSAGETTG